MGARLDADADADANANSHTDANTNACTYTRLFGHRAGLWLGVCERWLGAGFRYSRW